MSEQRRFQIINPPNRLRLKVPRTGGPDLKEVQAAAEEGLNAIKDELAAGARADLDAMATAMGKARECPAQAEEAFADILRRAADIKGQAVNFENPILGAAAASLTTYLEKAGSQADKKADVVEAHLQAMQLVMADESARTKDGEELLNALRELVARTLGH